MRNNFFYVSKEQFKFCIILDACRYDTFKKFNRIGGRLSKRISPASETPGWIKKNWGIRREFPDIVYVSANPFLSEYHLKNNFGRMPFYHLEPVWDYGWDEKLNTVPPEKVNEGALKCMKKFPAKKFVIHYIQPHHPFLRRPELDRRGYRDALFTVKDIQVPDVKSAYQLAEKGKIPQEIFITAYEENVQVVLEQVEKLLPHLKGKVLVTSDHGELLGEDGRFGHPDGEYPQLVEIPVLEVEK